MRATPRHLSGAVVSMSDYKSASLSSIPDEGTQRTAHPAVYPPKQVTWIPRIGKLWKLKCHSGPVSRGNRLLSTTGSKAYVTGDERPQLCTATVCAHTLPSLLSLGQSLMFCTS